MNTQETEVKYEWGLVLMFRGVLYPQRIKEQQRGVSEV